MFRGHAPPHSSIRGKNTSQGKETHITVGQCWQAAIHFRFGVCLCLIHETADREDSMFSVFSGVFGQIRVSFVVNSA